MIDKSKRGKPNQASDLPATRPATWGPYIPHEYIDALGRALAIKRPRRSRRRLISAAGVSPGERVQAGSDLRFHA